MTAGRIARSVAGGAVIGVAVACGVDESIIASVGDTPIEIAGLQGYISAAAGADWRAVDERVASMLLDQFLDQEVVAAAAARRRKVQLPSDLPARSAAVRSLIGEVCGAMPPVPEDVIEAEIARQLKEIRPARAHVRQLLLATAEEATAAHRRLELGESFLEVSRDVSLAPNADSGGELGFVAQGTLPEELDAVVFGVPAGGVSAPVASPTGHHVFQVLEVVAAGPPSRSEVAAAARRELGETAAREFTRSCVERLAGEVGVTLHEDHLWFSYDGEYGGGQ
jgi:hypothetical protein